MEIEELEYFLYQSAVILRICEELIPENIGDLRYFFVLESRLGDVLFRTIF